MKRKSARQLVRLLSDIRYARHCTTLRAAATNREMALAATEGDALDDDRDDAADTARDVRPIKPARSGS